MSSSSLSSILNGKSTCHAHTYSLRVRVLLLRWRKSECSTTVALLGTSYWHSIQMCTNHKVWIKRETTKCDRDNTMKELTRDITCKYGSRPIVHGLLSVVSTAFCSSVYLFMYSFKTKLPFDNGGSRSCSRGDTFIIVWSQKKNTWVTLCHQVKALQFDKWFMKINGEWINTSALPC